MLLHCLLALVIVDHGSGFVGQLDQFVNSRASAIAKAAAGFAAGGMWVVNRGRLGWVEAKKLAFAFVRGVGLAAILAQNPHQTLRQKSYETGGEEKGFNPHVRETGDGADRRVGVEGGEHQMSREARLYGDFGGFQ